MCAMSNTTEEERFEFGANWLEFLSVLSEERIGVAEKSLLDMLKLPALEGKTFIDVGSGSGLFSLAARRLGALVFSFDYDVKSVACTKELKRRYFDNDDRWTVCEGNALDKDWLSKLGQWDVVYSWGVLHHTGAMWKALANVEELVKPGGKLFISIYNDQGWRSRAWHRIKKRYNLGGNLTKALLFHLVNIYFNSRRFMVGLLLYRDPLHVWKTYKKNRGMSLKHDMLDWVGGYPFEVAKPEQIIDYYLEKGYRLDKLLTCGGGLGCNQYVFYKYECNAKNNGDIA